MITLSIASREFAIRANAILRGQLDEYRSIGESMLINNGFPDNYLDKLNLSIDEFGERIINPLVELYFQNEHPASTN